jgi:hypothetical protein
MGEPRRGHRGHPRHLPQAALSSRLTGPGRCPPLAPRRRRRASGVVPEEQRVLYAGVPGGHQSLEDDDCPGSPDRQHRHAGDGAAAVLGHGGVDRVVGTDDENDIGSVPGKSSLISSSSKTRSYGTRATASSTFMWTGRRPTTGWTPNQTATTLARNRVLRPGHGHAVARSDDDRRPTTHRSAVPRPPLRCSYGARPARCRRRWAPRYRSHQR